jgi:hypothetical protein
MTESQTDPSDPRARELARRIETLETLDEEAFGGFGGWDWAACIVGAILLPALALWWAAG